MYIKYLLEDGFSFGCFSTANGVFIVPESAAPDPSIVYLSFAEVWDSERVEE